MNTQPKHTPLLPVRLGVALALCIAAVPAAAQDSDPARKAEAEARSMIEKAREIGSSTVDPGQMSAQDRAAIAPFAGGGNGSSPVSGVVGTAASAAGNRSPVEVPANNEIGNRPPRSESGDGNTNGEDAKDGDNADAGSGTNPDGSDRKADAGTGSEKPAGYPRVIFIPRDRKMPHDGKTQTPPAPPQPGVFGKLETAGGASAGQIAAGAPANAGFQVIAPAPQVAVQAGPAARSAFDTIEHAAPPSRND